MTHPRTVAEFASQGLRVWLSCSSCGGVQVLAPDVLDAAFGPDFDLVNDWREVSRHLYCPACGASRPGVLFDEAALTASASEPEPVPARRQRG